MRKLKVYLGRNKGVNRFGKHDSDLRWAVPRLLRPYFILQRQRYYDDLQYKLNINGSYGSMGQHPAVDPADLDMGTLLQERRENKRKLMSGNF